MATLDSEPTFIDAGTSVAWQRSLSDYPAPGWALSYRLHNSKKSYAISSTGNADGTHSVSLTPAVTGSYVPGTYKLLGSVTDGVDVHIVARVPVNVRPNIVGGDVYDDRTANEKLLEAVRAAIAQTATANQLAMAYNGRQLSRHPLRDLRSLELELEDRVAREKGHRTGVGTTFAQTFRRPS